MDPMVNIALKFAFAEGLISITKTSKYKLTEKGRQFADQLLEEDDHLQIFQTEFPVLLEERALLVRIGKKVSELRLREELL